MSRRFINIASLVALWMFIFAILAPVFAVAQDVTGDDGHLPDGLSNEALWLIIAGVITSIITALVNQTHWKPQTKLVCFTAVATVISFISIAVRGDLHDDNWIRVLLIVFASGATFYKLTAPAMTALENDTTINPR